MSSSSKDCNTVKKYHHGQVILPQGFSGQAMGLVEKGRVEIFQKNEDGEDTALKMLNTNDMFGIGSLFGELERQTGVRSINKSIVTIMDRRDFIRRIHKNPQVAFDVLKSLCLRIKDMSEEVHDQRQELKNKAQESK
ncbi:MAG: cyclic nucleotide-binding domain-containing protein [Gammaproteobacteria bacterium]|jgi:CRP-like cAMP-binding protein|nr:cyclic nucleotide-binding domain-containing protein [Gammaproteobacteria bacterium]MBT4087616.1 cyclic nucleotide-binding domain-containing protein [Deltaproteobacteria bacterium]MBT3723050.1 cyclic nucleotide-binding domain-containing protein [Gammaproteobacteria bacterium]MBT4196749.1 cyclic nucleotide-binding domain-containing protein [Gammaproteobacteria bacterium]MBT4451868.1 cyclic nucleotide-binding domain-containing protein [Gammaproteobacteria bacterium]